MMILRSDLKLICVIFILMCCVGCSCLVSKKKEILMVDLVDGVESDSLSDDYVQDSRPTYLKDSFGRLNVMGTSSVGVVGDRHKIELLDTMPIYEFLLALLSPASFDLVMDSKIELSISCNMNSELSEQEILEIARNVCNSLGLTMSLNGKSCLVSLKNVASSIGKKVLIYQSKYIKSGQYLAEGYVKNI